MTSKMMVRSYHCLIRPGTLKNRKLVVSALFCKENANLNIISHFQVLKCKILQFDTLKFWWTFHDEICREIFDNFHRDSGEEKHCFCSFILPNEAELLRTFVPKMSYFITVGLILSDFVSEESIRPYFECLVVVVLRSPIHANEPSEYKGMLYRTSNRLLNNGIKVIILICMDGTSQYHHHRVFSRYCFGNVYVWNYQLPFF